MRLLTVDARITGRDRAALARVVEDADADIACVHHAPHLLRWRSISAAIGRRSGLVVVGGGRPAGANLLLSTLGVDALQAADVPLGGTPLDPAGAALALLRVGGVGAAPFVLVGARLTGSGATRAAQARTLQQAISRFVPGDPPVLLAVDGLAAAGTQAADVLRAGRRELGSGVFVDESVVAGEPAVASSAALPDGTRIPPPVTVEITLG
jgi:hypothetical protein